MSAIEKELEEWLKSVLSIYQFMDLSVVSSSNGLYKCFVPLNKNTGNHIKTVHAAFQWASVEMLGGLAVLSTRASKDYIPLVRKFDIEFICPASTDIYSEAVFSGHDAEKMNSAMLEAGRYDFDLPCKVKNIDDEIVAKAMGTYAVRIIDHEDHGATEIINME